MPIVKPNISKEFPKLSKSNCNNSEIKLEVIKELEIVKETLVVNCDSSFVFNLTVKPPTNYPNSSF